MGSQLVEDLGEAFKARLYELDEHLLRRAVIDPFQDTDYGDERTTVDMAARRAAASVVARARWREAVGPVMPTSVVCQMLGITRQALADRVAHHSLLALAGRRSRLYPEWQFRDHHDVHAIVPTLLRQWCEAEPDVDALTIAVWANTPNDNLGGERPAELIAERGSDKPAMMRVLFALDEAIARRTQ